MYNKKFKYLIIVGLCSIMLSGCGDKSSSSIDINLPVENSSTSETPVENTSSSSENSESKNDENSTSDNSSSESQTSESSSMSSVISKEDISDSATYKKQLEEYKKLTTFYEQLKLLIENDLLETYYKHNLGDSIETIVQDLDNSNFHYINNVTLEYLYDESHNLINMNKRKGLIVFSSSNLSSEEETGRLCNQENYKRSNAVSLKINASDCDFDSFIAYTFNDDGLLIGKFKYLLTEEKAKQVNIDSLSGSLNFTDKIDLKIDENASNKDVYEKIDLVKALIEDYDKVIAISRQESFANFKNIYESLTSVQNQNDLVKVVQENDLSIEKMPNSAITKFNQKYLNTYNEGYYISMSIDEKYTSPDMRYDYNYLVVIFDDSGKIWYRQIISDNYNDINCKDELNADDFSLVELYQQITKYNKKIDALSDDKVQFYAYLKDNMDLLNKNVTFEMNKTAILSEIEDSQLDFDAEYENQIITSVRNAKNESILLQDSYGENLYDSCVKVTDTNRTIFYFFSGDTLYGIYRSDYMDALKVTVEKYLNLGTIKKGMNQVIEKEDSYNQQKQLYVNMVNKKLSDFISTIGYASNHKDNQIYKRNDVIKSLSMSGFRYEEGMNKGDGLYFVGIYALDTDTKYAYKIYFNQDEQVELIQ